MPKGEYTEPERPEAAARREFVEETGMELDCDLIPLGEARQPSGKRICAFAARHDFDVSAIRSNVSEMEWPPKSGRIASFPEIDRAAWFPIEEARQRKLELLQEADNRNVSLFSGKVTLTGCIYSVSERDPALQAGSGVEGITYVDAPLVEG